MATVAVLNTTSQLSGKTICMAENDQTISGAWTFSGNQSFTGNVTIGNAVGDTLTVNSTIVSNLIFTDATYDIGASGATRPRDFFLSRNAAIGGTLAITGAATFDGNVTLGNASGDAILSTGTLTVTPQIVLTAGFQTTSGNCYIGDTANGSMTLGLTINQAGADNEALALKSSDVTHAMTDIAEADTYGTIQKGSATTGGVLITGLGSGSTGTNIRGIVTTADTTKTAAGVGAVSTLSYLRSGSSITTLGANGNLFVVADQGSARFIVDVEGDTFQDGTAGTGYSDYDDPMLALAVEHHINPKERVQKVFNKYCQYNKQSLIDAGILAADGPNGERGFVNMSALTRLNTGAAWQVGVEVRRLTQALLGTGVITQAQLEAAK